MRYVMRIVAGQASNRAAGEACRLTQPERRMRDLESVVCSIRGIRQEIKLVVGDRLARPIGENRAVEGSLLVRFKIAGLKVTLHADLKLPLPSQPRRVDDSCSHPFF